MAKTMNPKEKLQKLREKEKISYETYMAAKSQIEFFEGEDLENIEVVWVANGVLLRIELGMPLADGKTSVKIDLELSERNITFFSFSSSGPGHISSDKLMKLFKLSSFFQQKDEDTCYH